MLAHQPASSSTHFLFMFSDCRLFLERRNNNSHLFLRPLASIALGVVALFKSGSAFFCQLELNSISVLLPRWPPAKTDAGRLPINFDFFGCCYSCEHLLTVAGVCAPAEHRVLGQLHRRTGQYHPSKDSKPPYSLLIVPALLTGQKASLLLKPSERRG